MSAATVLGVDGENRFLGCCLAFLPPIAALKFRWLPSCEPVTSVSKTVLCRVIWKHWFRAVRDEDGAYLRIDPVPEPETASSENPDQNLSCVPPRLEA